MGGRCGAVLRGGRGLEFAGLVFAGLVFAGAATAGTALVGWLAVRGSLPVFDGAGFVGTLPGWGETALGAWMAAVMAVSLGLPLATLAVWGRWAAVRWALLAYVVVLGVQIAVEMVFCGVLFPDIVVLTGIVSTGYRPLQLDAARRRFIPVEGLSALGRAAVRLSLSLGLVFW